MAKATVTVAVIFFFFAVAAHARFPLDLAVNRAVATVDGDPVAVLPEPDFKTNLVLPSETKSESTAIVAWEPETAGAGITKTESSPEDSKSLAVISPRPINHGRFPRVPFSFPGSRCRKNHRRGRRGTGNGKGLVLAEKRERVVTGDRSRQFPGRLMRLRNPGVKNHMYKGKDMKMRHRRQNRNPQHRHVGKNKGRHQEKKHEHEHVHEQPEHVHDEDGHVHKKPDAFVMKIRKFLMSF